MRKIKKFILCVLILLTGINKTYAATFEGHHLATEIQIRCQQTQTGQNFRQNDNMEAILNYLRLLEYAGMPNDDPELQQGNTYRLTIHLADGKHRIYHVHADRFLSRDFRPWIKVESDHSLEKLLQTLPEEA